MDDYDGRMICQNRTVDPVSLQFRSINSQTYSKPTQSFTLSQPYSNLILILFYPILNLPNPYPEHILNLSQPNPNPILTPSQLYPNPNLTLFKPHIIFFPVQSNQGETYFISRDNIRKINYNSSRCLRISLLLNTDGSISIFIQIFELKY